MRAFLPLLLVGCTAELAAAGAPALELAAPVRKIWDGAAHNAFTGLIRFQERWYCVFREGDGHAKGAGAIRVLVSKDGADWQSAAVLAKPGVDLRDPHVAIAPDGRLMLNGGAAEPPTRDPVKDHYSFVSFSKDGKTWTQPERVLASWHWLWRVTWHKDIAYGVAYIWDPKVGAQSYRTALFSSKDGVKYEKVADLQQKFASEATLRFDGDALYCLQRRDGYRGITALLGASKPPYTTWEWKDLGAYVGGPELLKAPSGAWWVGGRSYFPPKGAKTVVSRLDVGAGKLTEALQLPSGGDTSYPGMVWHDNQLWVSYYSSHEGKTSIYLARLKVK
ncbi:MAG: glycoside hydrolase [Gemmataceae bacterium]|nr:glycoside hydrolase [Gemmataceae bacterium]